MHKQTEKLSNNTNISSAWLRWSEKVNKIISQKDGLWINICQTGYHPPPAVDNYLFYIRTLHLMSNNQHIFNNMHLKESLYRFKQDTNISYTSLLKWITIKGKRAAFIWGLSGLNHHSHTPFIHWWQRLPCKVPPDNHSHTLTQWWTVTWSNLEFTFLPKDILTCRPEEPGIELLSSFITWAASMDPKVMKLSLSK